MVLLLRDAGYAVTVISAMPNYPTGRVFPGYRGKLRHQEMMDGIRVIRLGLIPSNSGNLLVRGLSLITFLMSVLFGAGPRLLFSKTDLVIVSSPPLLTAWVYAFLARCGGKKVLVNISDVWPLTALEMGALRQGFIYRMLQKMEHSLYRKAHAFTGQSQEILDHLKASCRKEKNAFLYRNLQPRKERNAAVSSLPAAPFKVIYAGNLGHAQGILELCEAVDFKACNTELHIYGDGADREQLTTFLSQHPEKDIYLHPTIPQKELDEQLANFHAVLVPLKKPIYGAVPSKLFMAVAAGLPVLYSAGGEGENLVAQHRLGWIAAPGDYPALSAMICRAAATSDTERQQFHAAIQHMQETVCSKEVQDKAFSGFVAGLM